ncbi:MAG: T9SS type A sorting domain-containing protein [Bacteroidetes bacterium]|nr:T9SS type A sorting domain-containing protein [Bacteroidota bacterium]
MKQIFTLFIIAISFTIANAQLELTTVGSTYTLDFTGFAGEGFDAAGSDGSLDADTWAITGFSDGDKDFGEEATTGDFARGSTMGGETTGGIYGVDVFGNQGIMVQPGEPDFTPGSLRLKIWNNTGSAIGQLDIQYTVYVYNDQGRSSSLNFAHSIDTSSYTDEPTLDYTSGEAPAIFPETETKTISITGLNIPAGDFYYLKWEGDDVAGSGSRDEFALDDISITPYGAEASSEIQFSSIVLTATEGETATSYVVISEPADCSIEVSVDASSTASASDYEFASPLVLDFTSGGDAFLSFDVITNDDALVEPAETIVLKLMNVTGGCTIGFGDTFTLNLLDNDDTEPIVTEIADVTAEDVNGIGTSIGEFVQITGIVHGINLADAVGLNFTIIDETGGMRVFNAATDLSYTVAEKDEITVVGFVDQVNGLTQINAQSISLVSADNILETATTVTELGENTESNLVELMDVYYVNISEWLGDGSTFDVQVTDGINVFTVRIENSVDLASIIAPEGFDPYILNITGIGSQDDNSSPFTDGYILMPRYTSDFYINQGDAIEDISYSTISIYPNPVQDYLVIQSSENIYSIELYNTNGQSVFIENSFGQETSIDVNNLIPGLYVAKISAESGLYTHSFIKQ